MKNYIQKGFEKTKFDETPCTLGLNLDPANSSSETYDTDSFLKYDLD